MKADAMTFKRSFIWTIFVLLGLTLALVAGGAIRNALTPPKTETSFTSEQIQTAFNRILPEARNAAIAAVDPALDRVFAPVYQRIPEYADFHFSIRGEYAELGAVVLTQELGTVMQERLFAGFDDALTAATRKIGDTYREAAEQRLDVALRAGAPDDEAALPFSDATKLLRAETLGRVSYSAPLALLIAGGGAKAGFGTAVKGVASKLAARLMAKIAVKGTLKGGGVGAGALAGAAGGSLVGPVGSVVGGIAGAVATWLVVDGVVINLDEYFTRDDFERELRQAIDAEKARIRGEIIHAIAAATPDH